VRIEPGIGPEGIWELGLHNLISCLPSPTQGCILLATTHSKSSSTDIIPMASSSPLKAPLLGACSPTNRPQCISNNSNRIISSQWMAHMALLPSSMQERCIVCHTAPGRGSLYSNSCPQPSPRLPVSSKLPRLPLSQMCTTNTAMLILLLPLLLLGANQQVALRTKFHSSLAETVSLHPLVPMPNRICYHK
jgi:hypothetical protein